jgi:hypothetical protein
MGGGKESSSVEMRSIDYKESVEGTVPDSLGLFPLDVGIGVVIMDGFKVF